jgi:hypothetical protein
MRKFGFAIIEIAVLMELFCARSFGKENFVFVVKKVFICI